ncbi:uncharacterized protein LOC128039957 [Gossypium raimondii]|uniref:uncharacterized protein LOC128039957 n=1 Tax=Gossypium raimondii TaxID=29730 RepID=UPI00227B1806|nr:uncharacterized protein LOC128039957 [Gossypium raimondii]
MEFISRILLTSIKKDSMCVIVDRLTKSSHFIPVRANYSLQKLAKLYVLEIMRLHRVPVLIISNRDPCFIYQFWRKLHEALGSRLNFSTALHPQIDGQSDRVIQILEDMLRTSPVFVSESEDKIKLIQDLLKAAFDRQKSYADLKRIDIENSTDDYVFLKILKHVGPVDYKLELPLELDRIHDVFHVFMLRRYQSNPSHIVHVKEIEVRPDLTFEEEPVQTLNRNVKVLRRKSIPLVKVLWQNDGIEEAMWEPVDSIRQQYPHLFKSSKF